jgi:hypothetical protein
MLPNNSLSLLAPQSVLLDGDNRFRRPLFDYELAGIAINDTSAGMQHRIWKAWYVAPNVLIAPEDDLTNTVSVNVGNSVTELSLSFDINMRVTIAYMQSNICKLYWYDSSAIKYVTSSFDGFTSPFLTLDDKRLEANAYNDVIFFYVHDDNLCCRYQRDRYTIEHILSEVPSGRIVNAGMSAGNRVQVKYLLD